MNPPMMTERFEMRLSQSDLEVLDAWRARQSDVPSRSEAMRRLMEHGLAASDSEKRRLDFRQSEKLIVFMLCDLFKKLKLNGEFDPEFVAKAIYGGHYWALEWEHSGIFHNEIDSEAVLAEVVDVLDMWNFLEAGYANLSKQEKSKLEKEAEPFGKNVAFIGFDGNNEGRYFSIARFLIEEMNRFGKFKGRSLDAHMPTIDTHRRMLEVFSPIRKKLSGRELTVDDIIEVMKARLHPSRRK